MSSSPPAPDDLQDFLDELRAGRNRLRALARDLPAATGAEFADAVDTLTEQLLVADEELRVQSEQLEQSGRRLDLFVEVHEELFAGSPTPYLQSDADGVIVRYNHAARRLLNLPTVFAQTRTLAGIVLPADRATVRDLLSRLRRATGATKHEAPDRVEVRMRTEDGLVPVVVRARRLSDAGTGRPLLHWELQPAATEPVARRAGSHAQVAALADAAADLARQATPQETLEHIALLARRSIVDCDEASVTVVRPRGAVDSPAATGELATACDQLQYELHEGPCLAALDDASPVRIDDMTADTRWEGFASLAARLGVGSMLCVPLAVPRGALGALNLYARSPDAFDDDEQLVAQAFATHAGIALAHAELETNLRIGLQTREQIGRAVGILMARNRITSAAAFDLLVIGSQKSHRKLRDIAAWVNETGDDPVDFIK